MTNRKRTMQQASGATLQWIRPRNIGETDFKQLISPLSKLLATPGLESVYEVNDRSIYTATSEHLGPVGIKELRFETLSAQWRNATLRRHRLLGEFHVANSFAARGGNAPPFFAAALDFQGRRLTRALLVMQWLPDACTLTDAARGWKSGNADRHFAALSESLIAQASLGLVHGRHSSENILVTEPLEFHTIDFSHAQIYRKFNAAGFVRDVGRIAARLMIEGACDVEMIDRFIAQLCERVPTSVRAAAIRREIGRCRFESKQRQKLRRHWHTLWRGWPFRLG